MSQVNLVKPVEITVRENTDKYKTSCGALSVQVTFFRTMISSKHLISRNGMSIKILFTVGIQNYRQNKLAGKH